MTAKTKSFSADVESVRDIVINALYTNDEIFLRELLSNASDALEKRRHAALEDETKAAKLGIEIKFDDDAIEVIGWYQSRKQVLSALCHIWCR